MDTDVALASSWIACAYRTVADGRGTATTGRWTTAESTTSYDSSIMAVSLAEANTAESIENFRGASDVTVIAKAIAIATTSCCSRLECHKAL